MKQAVLAVLLCTCVRWDDAREMYCRDHPGFCADAGGTAGGAAGGAAGGSAGGTGAAGGGSGAAGGSGGGGVAGGTAGGTAGGVAGGAAGGMAGGAAGGQAGGSAGGAAGGGVNPCGDLSGRTGGSVIWSSGQSRTGVQNDPDLRLAGTGCRIFLAGHYDSLVTVDRFDLDGGMDASVLTSGFSVPTSSDQLAFDARDGYAVVAGRGAAPANAHVRFFPLDGGGTRGPADVSFFTAQAAVLRVDSGVPIASLYGVDNQDRATLVITDMFMSGAGSSFSSCSGVTIDRAQLLPDDRTLISGRAGGLCNVNDAGVDRGFFAILPNGPVTSSPFDGGAFIASARDGYVWTVHAGSPSSELTRWTLQGSGQISVPAFPLGATVRDIATAEGGNAVYVLGDVTTSGLVYGGRALPQDAGTTRRMPFVARVALDGGVDWLTGLGEPTVDELPLRIALIDRRVILGGFCPTSSGGTRCPGLRATWVVVLAP